MEIPSFGTRPRGGSPGAPPPVALLIAWWRAVGSPMARIVSPRGILGRRLQVAVPDPRWKREIEEHLDQILARLRQDRRLGELEGIDLVLEPPSATGSGASRALPGGVSGGAPPESRFSAARISEPGLARRWESAVTTILTRRVDTGDGS
jgi:hypothetical protein